MMDKQQNRSPAQVELTMELRWRLESKATESEPTLQQAGFILGESHKTKVWFDVPFCVVADD